MVHLKYIFNIFFTYYDKIDNTYIIYAYSIQKLMQKFLFKLYIYKLIICKINNIFSDPIKIQN